MTYTGSQINKQTLETTLQQEITNATNKANNSWQMRKYNDTSVSNLGKHTAERVLFVSNTDWKNNGNVEQLDIYLPFNGAFSGFIKATYTSFWGGSDSHGGATVIYRIGNYPPNGVRLNDYTLEAITPDFAKDYYIHKPYINPDNHTVALIIQKSPGAGNPFTVKLELQGFIVGGDDAFTVMYNTSWIINDTGSPTHSGYPWKPQTTSYLLANNYNGNTSINNLSANVATRVFPTIIWENVGIELWETNVYLNQAIWGVLELDIAGFSTMGGAKVVVELGINVLNATEPSVELLNNMKVVTASAAFTENFYIRVEHRADSRLLLIQIFKRSINDGLTVTAKFTSTFPKTSSFDLLNRFSNGSLFTNIAGVPTTRQKDFDARIKENFTLFSSFKAKIASATTDKGVPTNADATGDQMAANIRAISSGYKGTFGVPAMNPYTSTDFLLGPFNFLVKNYSSDLPGVQMCDGIQAQTPNEPNLKADFIYPVINNGNGTYSLKITIRNQSGNVSNPRQVKYFVAP